MNPKVHYGHRVIMMCQCRFISCHKYTTKVGNVDNGNKGYVAILCMCVLSFTKIDLQILKLILKSLLKTEKEIKMIQIQSRSLVGKPKFERQ